MSDETNNSAKVGNLDLFENATPPEWMNQEFFETVIRHHLKDPRAEIHNFKISPGSKPGDNFVSIVYRCKLNYSTKSDSNKEISLIIKTSPKASDTKKDFMEMSLIFQGEMEMYEGILPEIQNLWKSAGDNSKLCPNLIYQAEKPNLVIILEDVSALGFGLIDKPSEDYEVSKMIVQRLAKFHAGSFYLVSDKKRDYTHFDVNIYKNMEPKMLAAVIDDTVKILMDNLKSWEGFEEYIPRFQNYLETYKEKCLKLYEPNSHYNVLNHGDHHIKNLMYQHIDGVIKDVRFIDFQITCYNSPAIDLIYSLYSALSANNRQKYRDDYIKYYHDEFVKALKSYGYLKKPPSLMDLQIELLKCGTLEVILAACFSIYQFLDWNTINPEEFSFDNVTDFKNTIFSMPECQRILKAELQRFLYKGIL